MTSRTRPLYVVLVVAIAICFAIVFAPRPAPAARSICAEWRVERIDERTVSHRCMEWR